jgi:hypothetical protein
MLGQVAKSTQLLAEIRAGSDNQQRLINDKLGETIFALKDMTDMLRVKLDAIASGLERDNKLLSMKLDNAIGGLNNQTRLLNEKLDSFIAKSHDARRPAANSSDRVERPATGDPTATRPSASWRISADEQT